MTSSSKEKASFENVEGRDSDHVGSTTKGAVVDSEAVVAVDDFGFSPAEQRKIIRRVDRRLVLTVGAIYCISLMDRTNLGAASIAGMGEDLNLIGTRYVSFLVVFDQ